MRKFCYYIISFLILSLSVGQKDIQYFLKEAFDTDYSVEFEKRKEKEAEEDGKEELKEEKEGKRKKETYLSHFSSGALCSFAVINHFEQYFYLVLKTITAKQLSIAKYISFCCLIFYS